MSIEKEILLKIDERVDELKNKRKKVLKLTNEEYEILKRSLIAENCLEAGTVLVYRTLKIRTI